MKRLLLLLALCLMLAAPVMASYTFQNGGDLALDNTSHFSCWGTYQFCYYVASTSGGNSYVETRDADAILVNTLASPTTYWATTSTMLPGGGYQYSYINLYDNAKNLQWHIIVGQPGTRRYELTMVGGTPYLYCDGILIANGTAPLSQNPSYIGIGSHNYPGGDARPRLDDLIGSVTESKYIVGMPESNGYYIKKDMVNPASSGLYNSTTGALVNSNTMYTTWGRSNITYAGNESMYLVNVDTHTVYETQYTGTASAGTTAWDIGTSLIANGAPYGRYQVKFGDFYSDEIAYIANGASISFDQSSYNQQDTATITYLIDGAYWDTSTYTYSMKIYSANDWSVVSDQPLTASSGVLTYQFTSNDPQGEYYAVIVAVPNVGGSDIWLNYDYAALTAYAAFSGYVNDAETTLPISGANVSFSQNGIVSNSITTADGNYTANGFMTGTPLVINTTATGYYQYYVSFTPLTHGSKLLNITLNSTTPTYTGLGIGGVIRDGIFSGGTITKGYGRPIPAAATHLLNATYGESCTGTSNNAGWYLFDESNCILTTGRLYDIWSEKIGYSNSPNYTAVAA